MLRAFFTVVLSFCMSTHVLAAVLDGTIISVSKTGFVLQTSKGPKVIKYGDHLLKGVPSKGGEVFDAIYPLKPDGVFEGMEVCVEYRRVDTDWVCDCARIDFAALAKADGKYTLHLKLVAMDGTKFEKKYEIAAGTKFEAVRDMVARSLQPTPLPKDRWAVSPYAVKLLKIDGFIKDNKFSPIEKVEVTCPDLKAEAQPEVRQRFKWSSK